MAAEGSSGSHLNTSKRIHIYTNLKEGVNSMEFEMTHPTLQVYYYIINVYMMDKPKNNIDLEGLRLVDREIFPSRFRKMRFSLSD